MPAVRRLTFGSLLPRPGLRMALATGAALLIAVPVGVETMKTFRPVETVQQVELEQTEQTKLPDNDSPAPAPREAQEALLKTLKRAPPTVTSEPSRDTRRECS